MIPAALLAVLITVQGVQVHSGDPDARPFATCEYVGKVRTGGFTAATKGDVDRILAGETVERGGNAVQIRRLMYSRLSGKWMAKGRAYQCNNQKEE